MRPLVDRHSQNVLHDLENRSVLLQQSSIKIAAEIVSVITVTMTATGIAPAAAVMMTVKLLVVVVEMAVVNCARLLEIVEGLNHDLLDDEP